MTIPTHRLGALFCFAVILASLQGCLVIGSSSSRPFDATSLVAPGARLLGRGENLNLRMPAKGTAFIVDCGHEKPILTTSVESGDTIDFDGSFTQNLSINGHNRVIFGLSHELAVYFTADAQPSVCPAVPAQVEQAK